MNRSVWWNESRGKLYLVQVDDIGHYWKWTEGEDWAYVHYRYLETNLRRWRYIGEFD